MTNSLHWDPLYWSVSWSWFEFENIDEYVDYKRRIYFGVRSCWKGWRQSSFDIISKRSHLASFASKKMSLQGLVHVLSFFRSLLACVCCVPSRSLCFYILVQNRGCSVERKPRLEKSRDKPKGNSLIFEVLNSSFCSSKIAIWYY